MMQTLGMAHQWNPYPGDILESWNNLTPDLLILRKWDTGAVTILNEYPSPHVAGRAFPVAWCIVEVPKEPEPKPVTFWDISQVLRLGKVLQEGDELTRMLAFLDEKAEEEEEQPQPAVEPEEPEAEAKPRIWRGEPIEVHHWCWHPDASRSIHWVKWTTADLKPGDIFVGGDGQRPTVDPTGMQLEDCSVVDWLGTNPEENAEPAPEVKPAFTYEEAREFILEEHNKWDNSEGDEGRQLELVGENLKGADLEKADLRYARLTLTYLGGANLGGADLSEADLRGARFSGAKL